MTKLIVAVIGSGMVLISTAGCIFLQGFEDHSRLAIKPPILAYALNGGLDEVKNYVQANGDVNATDVMGNTPLMMAAVEDHVDVVKYLLSRGANPWLRNKAGERALDIARRGAPKRSTKILEDSMARRRSERS